MVKRADEDPEGDFALPDDRDDDELPVGAWLDDPSYDVLADDRLAGA